MTAQKHVLVVVDPTASVHPAIERAAWLARHLPVQHRAIRQRLRRASRRLALAESCRRRRRTQRRARAASAPARAARRAAARSRAHGRSTRAGTTRCTTVSFESPSIRRGHRREGHALPLGAAALDLLEHRLESDSRMCRHALARQAAAAGPAAMLHRSRGPAARARQACGSRQPDTHRPRPSSAPHSAAKCTSSTHSTCRPPLPLSTDSMAMPIALPVDDFTDAMRAEHTEAVAGLCAKRTAVPPERTHVAARQHARAADDVDGSAARRRRVHGRQSRAAA